MSHDETQPPPTIRANPAPAETEPPDTDRGSTSQSSAAPLMPGDGPPDLPGFDLGELIGRGGMGVVYAAHDIEVGREVAVKLLRPEHVGHESATRRFVEEARITGQLQHPGVPAVYRVGIAPDGSPFLAMKLVNGRTLADLLRDRDSPAADRGRFLAIFEGIGQAVGYAHAHGVIHRDLKPQNVMVGAFGEVQVMDWGLAKVLADGPGEQAASFSPVVDTIADTPVRSRRNAADATSAGSVLGTPAFMPPEQAIGAVEKVDRRSDVFGLGGILCAILTGKPPYVGDSAESIRQLAARAKLDDAFARLAACDADPDVVALCKRCLSAEPADRPADAGAVTTAVAGLRAAADERARQAERAKAAGDARRRIMAWAAAAVVLVSAAGVAASLWQAGRAEAAAGREKERADGEAAARADANRQTAAAVAQEQAATTARAEADKQTAAAVAQERAATAAKEFLQFVLQQTSADGQTALGRPADPNLTMKQALDFAATQLASRFPDQPLIEADLRDTIGRAYRGMGRPADARPHYTQTLALREAALPPDDPTVLNAVNNLGLLLLDLRDPAAAEPLLKRALAGREKVFGPDAATTLESLANWATFLNATGQIAAAEQTLRRVLAGREKALGPDDPATLMSANNLAVFLMSRRRDYRGAEPLLQRALAGREKQFGGDNPLTLTSANNLAALYRSRRDYAAAEPLLKRVLAGREKAFGPDHPSVIESVGNLGGVLVDRGDYAAAELLLKRALAWHEAKGGPDDPAVLGAVVELANLYRTKGDRATAEPLYRRAIAGLETAHGPNDVRVLEAVTGLAALYRANRDYAAAEPLYRQVLSGREKSLGPTHRDTITSINNLGLVLEAKGETAAAEVLFRRALAGYEAASGPDHMDTRTAAKNLASLLLGTGRGAEAVPLFDRYMTGLRARLGATPLAFADQLDGLSAALLRYGQLAAAERHLRESLAIRAKSQPDGWMIFATQSMLGEALLARKQYTDAEPLLVAGFDGLKEREKDIPPAARGLLGSAVNRLIALADATDRPADAAKWRTERLKYLPELAPSPRTGR